MKSFIEMVRSYFEYRGVMKRMARKSNASGHVHPAELRNERRQLNQRHRSQNHL